MSELKSIVEALIFASPEPLTLKALGKLLDAMRPEDKAAAEALGGRIWTRARHDPRDPADRSGRMRVDQRPPAARVLDEAIRDQVVVLIDYTDGSGERSERRPVEPQIYALNGDQWFLLAWCRRRRAGRWFRLDRVDKAVLTTEPALPRDLVELFGEPPPEATPLLLG